MSDNFYRAFEDRHRGSRELIKDRLRVYIPFVEPLLAMYPHGKAIDLGCGRGEWLELLHETGFNAHGVDLDQGMLDGCFERGLSAEQGDAITFLSSLPNETQCIVSAFHVVEHISFEKLQSLVSEALRVLVPGGLLILETPNPENLVVATRHFYLDPSHLRPIPPDLLVFVTEYNGFARSKVIRLQEDSSLATRANLQLQDVLSGASPDFSVVAQKTGPQEIISRFEASFMREYGLSLENLTVRYQNQLMVCIQQAEAKAQQAESKAQQAENAAVHWAAELHGVYSSKSWRVTAPIRWTCGQVRRLRQEGLRSRTKALAQKAFRKTNRALLRWPNFRQYLIKLSIKLGVYEKLRLVEGGGVVNSDSMRMSMLNKYENLPHSGRHIYSDLKHEIKNSKERSV